MADQNWEEAEKAFDAAHWVLKQTSEKLEAFYSDHREGAAWQEEDRCFEEAHFGVDALLVSLVMIRNKVARRRARGE